VRRLTSPPRDAIEVSVVPSHPTRIACNRSPAGPSEGPLATGRWTGDGACLSVTDTGCNLAVGCGHGQFPRPIIRAGGTFNVDGTYRIEVGPISIEPAPPARRRRRERAHARRGRSELRGHPGAHPPDRGQGARQAPPPVTQPKAPCVLPELEVTALKSMKSSKLRHQRAVISGGWPKASESTNSRHWLVAPDPVSASSAPHQ
jgi:hypothetical protein